MPSELRDSLDLTNNPAVGSRIHQHNIMHSHMFVVYGFVAIENLKIVVRSIVQFNQVTFGSVEHRLDFVTLIEVARTEAAASLTGHLAGKPRISCAYESKRTCNREESRLRFGFPSRADPLCWCSARRAARNQRPQNIGATARRAQ